MRIFNSILVACGDRLIVFARATFFDNLLGGASMLHILAMIFTIAAFPLGTAPVGDQPAIYQQNWVPEAFWRPTLIAMSRDGFAAFVVRSDSSPFKEDVVTMSADGHWSRIKGPTLSDARTDFAHFEVGSGQVPHFQSISIDSRHAIFATVACQFSGAFSGLDETVVKFDGKSWKVQGLPGSRPAGNSWTDLPLSADFQAIETDNLTAPSDSGAYRFPDLFLYGANVIVRAIDVVATASNDRVVLGYHVDPTPDHRVSCRTWPKTIASFGPVGVCWGVNNANVVVGDDRRSLAETGSPVIWAGGKLIRVSASPGTVFSISNEGYAVGDTGSGGFIASRVQNWKSTPLDALIACGHWHINHAFLVADNGSILAEASLPGKPARLVVLRRR